MLLLVAALYLLLPTPPPVPRTFDRHGTELTPIADAELLATLAAAHVEVMGAPASPARLRILRALVRGEGTPKEHNLGNVGADRKGQPFHVIGGSRFRSFPDFDAGARALLELLRARCGAALVHADAGDAMAVGAHLRICGYHRSDPGAYGRSLRRLAWVAR